MSSAVRPTLFFLHALGGSARAVDAVAARLAGRIDVVGLDLPGFGERPAAVGTDVEAMVADVGARIAQHSPTRWLLAGHSMGAKVATVLAARTMAGATPLFGLAGVVLLAGSPPSPEPMAQQRREQMLGWAADGPLDADAARTFVDANVGAPLPPAVDAAVLADLARTDPEAWRAWLARGSREDWSGEVGRLDVPALLLAGGADGDLGAEAQQRLNGAVYPRARLVVLDGAGHLLPRERPAEVADAILEFWAQRAGRGPAVPAEHVRLIASPRTSARTRAILAGRALADDPDYVPQVVNPAQLMDLRAFADAVVPQGVPSSEGIDLAVRLDAQLAAGKSDGWRFAGLPSDADALRAALDALAGLARLSPEGRRARLTAVAEGSDAAPGALGADGLAQWFEDAVNDLVRHWLGHPATMARIGFDGYASGGDGSRLAGWQRLDPGGREAWEPVSVLGGAR